MTQPKADLVFEGGGVKGIGFAGALRALAERDYEIRNVAGTSAGAITAALVAAGYSAQELDEILSSLPFDKFADRGIVDPIPLVGSAISVLSDLGIHEGNYLRQWMTDRLAEKNKVRFKDLLNPDADDPQDPAQRWRLRVIASDLTDKRMLILPQDAGRLGIEPDELAIADAVRMSMSIPVFFEPVVHHHGGQDIVVVDGGVLSNFPVWLFDRNPAAGPPRWPTFGLLLVEPEPTREIGERLDNEAQVGARGGLVDHIKSLAMTAMAAHDRLYLDAATYVRTIGIPTLGVGTTEFDITPERASALNDSGYDAANAFLAEWNFEHYVENIRDQVLPGRRETLRDFVPPTP